MNQRFLSEREDYDGFGRLKERETKYENGFGTRQKM